MRKTLLGSDVIKKSVLLGCRSCADSATTDRRRSGIR
jgi:hypothetical protein